MKIVLFKYAIILVIIVISILILRSFFRAPEGIINKIKENSKNLEGDRLMEFLVPGYEMEEKVKEYKKERKLTKNKKRKIRKNKLLSGAKRSKNKHEEKVRDILEEYFDDYFPTCRPKFLRNPKTGRCLELDGYNARLNLAFEYQGIQHRQFTPRFHSSPEDFEKQLYRDSVKKEILDSLEIDLLEIPDTIKYEKLEIYVKTWLKNKGY